MSEHEPVRRKKPAAEGAKPAAAAQTEPRGEVIEFQQAEQPAGELPDLITLLQSTAGQALEFTEHSEPEEYLSPAQLEHYRRGGSTAQSARERKATPATAAEPAPAADPDQIIVIEPPAPVTDDDAITQTQEPMMATVPATQDAAPLSPLESAAAASIEAVTRLNMCLQEVDGDELRAAIRSTSSKSDPDGVLLRALGSLSALKQSLEWKVEMEKLARSKTVDLVRAEALAVTALPAHPTVHTAVAELHQAVDRFREYLAEAVASRQSRLAQ